MLPLFSLFLVSFLQVISSIPTKPLPPQLLALVALVAVFSCKCRMLVAIMLPQPYITVVTSILVDMLLLLQQHIALPLLANNATDIAASSAVIVGGSCFDTTFTFTDTHFSYNHNWSPVHFFIIRVCHQLTTIPQKTQFTLTRMVHYRHKCWDSGFGGFIVVVDFATKHYFTAKSMTFS